MSTRILPFPLVLSLVAVGCDPAGREPTESRRLDDAGLQLIAAERDHSITHLAFQSADAAADRGCAAIVIDDAAVVVAGPSDVVAVCDAGADECTLELTADDAMLQSCGVEPEALAEHALDLVGRGEFRLGDYCPPSEQSCEPGGGYSCIDPVCKSACGHELQSCRTACNGNSACKAECANEAQFCFSSCC